MPGSWVSSDRKHGSDSKYLQHAPPWWISECCGAVRLTETYTEITARIIIIVIMCFVCVCVLESTVTQPALVLRVEAAVLSVKRWRMWRHLDRSSIIDRLQPVHTAPASCKAAPRLCSRAYSSSLPPVLLSCSRDTGENSETRRDVRALKQVFSLVLVTYMLEDQERWMKMEEKTRTC